MDPATCSSTRAAAGRSAAGVCVTVMAAAFLFVFGVIFGAVLHAIVFSEGGSPLSRLKATPTTAATLLLSSVPKNSSEVSDYSDDDMDTSNEIIYDVTDQSHCNDFPWNNFRLPRDVIPLSYNLTIHPNITTQTLSGSVAIDIKVLNATKLIVLNANNIVMAAFSISVNLGRTEAELYTCPMLSQWAFVLDEELVAGDIVELGIEFNGEVLTDLHGLYISTHTDERGKKTQSAITQFEPSYARKMFPCFDEPNFKATFQLSVIREAHHTVRSNMVMKVSREHIDGLYIDVFERTVKMSTYLLAVAILDNYDFVKRSTKNTQNSIEVRLYAPKDVISGQTEFGLDTTIRALEYFEKYFNTSYPLDKVDLVALDDFSEGAMENWGLLTFRDSTLLHSNNTTTTMMKEHVALVICHEVAHQWFGNLVTMDWWNDLWLNEGFANYMEYRCVDQLFPDWDIMKRFYTENIAFSHEIDGLRGSRAISAQTSNETNIMGLFDALSYHKASAILRMLQSLTGEQNFRLSLIQYLDDYAYDNAEGTQLWEIVEKHAVLPEGISIQDLANAYITQVGCPMIFVTLSDTEIVVHNQSRYFAEVGMHDDTEWPIPIHYRTDVQTEPRLEWVNVDESTVSWPLMNNSKWIIANTGGISYVKVLYDTKNYAELAKQLHKNHSVISTVDRSMILVDAFDFSKSAKLNIEIYLDLLLYATAEMDRLVWSVIVKQMRYIEDLIEGTSFARIFKDLQTMLIRQAYEKAGWDTKTASTPDEKGLQVEMLAMACRLRNKDCIKEGQHRYYEWINEGKRPSPEILGIVLNEGVRQGGIAAWDKAYKTFLETKNPTEKQQLLGAMASTLQPALISRMLHLCIGNSSFRPNIIPRVLSELSKTGAKRAITWRFFRVNYKEFAKILGDGSNLLISSIRAIIDRFSTQEELDEVKLFLSDKNLEFNKVRLNQIYEQIELNIQWRRLNEEPFRQWLHEWDQNRRLIHHRRIRRHRQH